MTKLLSSDNLGTYDNIRKSEIGGESNNTNWLYNYFLNYYKMTAIDISKQLELDTDGKQSKKLILLEM